MIAKLTGVLDSIGQDWAVIDVGGVGYLVYCSGRTLSRLPQAGEPATLHVETHVREDHIHLYGFADEDERAWYRLLTTVQGVGARVGLAILSVLAPDQLAQAIAAQDRTALTRADGVGPKVAARILNELKDKAGGIALGAAARTGAKAGDGPPSPSDGVPADAVSALVNLGYSRSESFGAVAHAVQRLGGEATLEALVREGLVELGR
ncbi:MAG: Holliday junction branch migration protein RuvA [Rhodospirillaceae bacterium]|nr:Holliday junction branch migration protein RuvA [Rhodospirillaceae bacterium]